MINKFLDKLNKNDNSKNAIIHKDNFVTYGELLEKINSNYKFISKSFEEKKVVVILGDYSFNSIATIFALSLHKCIFVPIISENENELNKKIEIANPDYIIDCKSLIIKTFEKKSNKKNDFYDQLFNKNNSGLVLFSSGSTGVPKAMIHDFDNLLSAYLQVKLKNLIFIVFLLFDHIGGLNTMLNILSMGSTMIIPHKREPETIANLIENYKVNILPASPTFLNLMNIAGVFEKNNFSSLKLITYGTEPMPENLLYKLKAKLPKTRFIQTFGTSETGIIKTKSKSSESLLLKFDDNNQQVKIVNGELWIKSNTRVLGYINHDNTSFTEDGWFKTGDLVEEIEDGYLRIIGRKNNIINVAGEKVFPNEVENIITQLDFIDDCTVFAQTSPITGQLVAAKIVLNKNEEDKNKIKKEIKAHCKKNLDRFKVPVKIFFDNKINFSNRFKKNLNI